MTHTEMEKDLEKDLLSAGRKKTAKITTESALPQFGKNAVKNRFGMPENAKVKAVTKPVSNQHYKKGSKKV